MASKILIADDALYMRLNLKKILFRFGCKHIDEACTGKEALEKCKTEFYDLVFMDITMPEMDGIEALHLIKAHNKKQKIVILTAMGEQDWIIKAISEGADEFLLKPFKENQIVEVLQKHLEP